MNMLKGNQSKQRKTEEMEWKLRGKGIYPLLSQQDMLNALRIRDFPLQSRNHFKSNWQTHTKKVCMTWLLAPTDLEKRMTKSEKKLHRIVSLVMLPTMVSFFSSFHFDGCFFSFFLFSFFFFPSLFLFPFLLLSSAWTGSYLRRTSRSTLN